MTVYYDAHNIVGRAKNVEDICAEPKILGQRIRQIQVLPGHMGQFIPGT